MNKMISGFSAVALGLILTLAPVKKAEAGLILIPVTGGASLAITGVGIAAGLTGLIMNDGANYESDLATIIMVSGSALILLDAQDALTNQKAFKTIPPYIFSEIKTLAESKISTAKEVRPGIKEVLLSNEEVDVIFEMADDSSDAAELKTLRIALTTSGF